MTCGALRLNRDNNVLNNSSLVILSGGDLTTTGQFLVGSLDGDVGNSTVTVGGSGSTITQTGAAAFIVGNFDTSGNGNNNHFLSITEGAVVTTGTNFAAIRESGGLDIFSGGQFITGQQLFIEGTLTYGLDSSSETIQVGTNAIVGEGDLVVDTAASFTPTVGDTFVLLEAGGVVSGVFDNVTFSGVPDDLQYEIVIQRQHGRKSWCQQSLSG